MEKEVEDSIKKFEQKQEFREVKLKTRQSFREDQAALERRLSTYRPGHSRRREPSAAESGGQRRDSDSGQSGERSRLESIVLDISSERDKVDIADYINGITAELKPEVEIYGTNDVYVNVDNVGRTVNGHSMSGHEEPGYVNGGVPNGAAPRAMHVQPRVKGHIPASMTPEPRMKTSGRRIYEKNPKLTSASTEHLDTISLKGSRSTNPAHGLRLVDMKPQQNFVPIVPSLPVSSIPADGNLRDFNVDEMVTIFRMLNVDEEMLLRFSANKVDGRRFAMFTDKDLETLGIGNPIVRYFRDRTAHRRKQAPAFML